MQLQVSGDEGSNFQIRHWFKALGSRWHSGIQSPRERDGIALRRERVRAAASRVYALAEEQDRVSRASTSYEMDFHDSAETHYERTLHAEPELTSAVRDLVDYLASVLQKP